MILYFAVAISAILAGGIASVAGFGIGSILTPLVATQYGMKAAIAAVSIPHVIATGVRFWRLRAQGGISDPADYRDTDAAGPEG